MNEKKTIIIISGVFPPEQVTSAFLNYDLARCLSEEFRVVVLRPRPTRPEGSEFSGELWQDPHFETIQIESYTNPKSTLIGRFREAIDFSRECMKYIRTHNKEIAFVYNDAWQLFGLFLIAKVCAKYSIPYIVPIQDIYPESIFTSKSFPKLIEKIGCKLLLPIDRYYQSHALKIRTITKEMADYLSESRNISRDKYLVVNNWQNDDAFDFKYELNESEKLIFTYVGSINEHANVELIIRAFTNANIDNAELRIFGNGNQKDRCKNLVSELGNTRIIFDSVNRKDVPKIQAEADFLVMALTKGNGNLCLPSKLTSYMLSGKPIIASVDLQSSTAHIISDERCGIVVAPDDIESLTQAFIAAKTKTSSEILNMSINSREYALRNFTKELNLRKVVNIIKNNINKEF